MLVVHGGGPVFHTPQSLAPCWRALMQFGLQHFLREPGGNPLFVVFATGKSTVLCD